MPGAQELVRECDSQVAQHDVHHEPQGGVGRTAAVVVEAVEQCVDTEILFAFLLHRVGE